MLLPLNKANNLLGIEKRKKKRGARITNEISQVIFKLTLALCLDTVPMVRNMLGTSPSLLPSATLPPLTTSQPSLIIACVCASVPCHSVVSNSLQPYGLMAHQAPLLWGFPGKNTEAGCHFLLQGIFLNQGSNPSLASPALAGGPGKP